VGYDGTDQLRQVRKVAGTKAGYAMQGLPASLHFRGIGRQRLHQEQSRRVLDGCRSAYGLFVAMDQRNFKIAIKLSFRGKLLDLVVEEARAEGKKIIPSCSYALM
jgi:predicted GNAT family acetyltransferase